MPFSGKFRIIKGFFKTAKSFSMSARPVRKIASVNPFTNEKSKEYEFLSNDELLRKIEQGNSAFLSLRKLTFSEKVGRLMTFIKCLEERSSDLASLITSEMGKPIVEARTEVARSINYIKATIEKGESFLREEIVQTEAKKSYVRYEPLGLIYFIIPFNYPLYLNLKYVATNLLIGNTAIVRGPDSTPKLFEAIQEVFTKAGFEGEYLNVLSAPDQLELILSDPRVKGVKFTGSSLTGSIICSVAGKYFKKTLMELGGSDPFIVLPDANIQSTTDLAVRARLTNAGQICCSPKRFIVHESVYEEFKKVLAEKVAKLKLGDPLDESTQLGPLARADILLNAERQVNEAIKQGGKVLTGGKRPTEEALQRGNFFLPTVIEVDSKNILFTEEVFAPVIPLVSYSSEEEAIELANNTNYGLGGIIASEDRKKAEELALKLETGMVFINHHVMSDPRLPFGGVKNSGGGRDGGKFSFFNFTNIKTVWVD